MPVCECPYIRLPPNSIATADVDDVSVVSGLRQSGSRYPPAGVHPRMEGISRGFPRLCSLAWGLANGSARSGRTVELGDLALCTVRCRCRLADAAGRKPGSKKPCKACGTRAADSLARVNSAAEHVSKGLVSHPIRVPLGSGPYREVWNEDQEADSGRRRTRGGRTRTLARARSCRIRRQGQQTEQRIQHDQ